MNEKRKEHRLRANIPIQLAYGPGKDLRGRTENLSRLGTYVELPEELPVGQTVDIVLELPPYTQDASLTGEVRCEGTVFRSGPARETAGRNWYGAGVFFTDFASLRDKEKVSAYVDYLIVTEEQEIKEGLRRRHEKEAAHRGNAEQKDAIVRQEEFQKAALSILQQISSRLEALARDLRAKKR